MKVPNRSDEKKKLRIPIPMMDIELILQKGAELNQNKKPLYFVFCASFSSFSSAKVFVNVNQIKAKQKVLLKMMRGVLVLVCLGSRDTPDLQWSRLVGNVSSIYPSLELGISYFLLFVIFQSKYDGHVFNAWFKDGVGREKTAVFSFCQRMDILEGFQNLATNNETWVGWNYGRHISNFQQEIGPNIIQVRFFLVFNLKYFQHEISTLVVVQPRRHGISLYKWTNRKCRSHLWCWLSNPNLPQLDLFRA